MFDVYLSCFQWAAIRSSGFVYSRLMLTIAQDRTNNGDLLVLRKFSCILYKRGTGIARRKTEYTLDCHNTRIFTLWT